MNVFHKHAFIIEMIVNAIARPAHPPITI
jgi:hypothetical protein